MTGGKNCVALLLRLAPRRAEAKPIEHTVANNEGSCNHEFGNYLLDDFSAFCSRLAIGQCTTYGLHLRRVRSKFPGPRSGYNIFVCRCIHSRAVGLQERRAGLYATARASQATSPKGWATDRGCAWQWWQLRRLYPCWRTRQNNGSRGRHHRGCCSQCTLGPVLCIRSSATTLAPYVRRACRPALGRAAGRATVCYALSGALR